MDDDLAAAFTAIALAIGRYVRAIDGGDLDGIAGLFAPDGRFTLPDGTTFTGRNEIGEGLRRTAAVMAAGVEAQRARGEMPPGPFRHLAGLPVVTDHGPGSAAVDTSFLVLDGVALDHWGRWIDRWIAVDGNWLLSEHRIAVDGRRDKGTA